MRAATERFIADKARIAIVLRWLDTVFKKLSYSLLNTLNFRTVKFK